MLSACYHALLILHPALRQTLSQVRIATSTIANITQRYQREDKREEEEEREQENARIKSRGNIRFAQPRAQTWVPSPVSCLGQRDSHSRGYSKRHLSSKQLQTVLSLTLLSRFVLLPFYPPHFPFLYPQEVGSSWQAISQEQYMENVRSYKQEHTETKTHNNNNRTRIIKP